MIVKLKHFSILLVLLFAIDIVANCQSVQNVKATLREGKVFLTYDLIGEGSQKFDLNLYGSHNNFSARLTRVIGDIGKEVVVGTNKKVEWDVSELGNFEGDVTFKVRGEALVLPFSFTTPAAGGSLRRGKSTTVQWIGGKKDQTVKLDLYNKDGQRIETVTETKNSGAVVWWLPSKLTKGSYTLKLTGGTQSVQSGEFVVKSKIPLLLKVAPVLLVGGIVGALGGGGKTTSGGPLPPAPDPK